MSQGTAGQFQLFPTFFMFTFSFFFSSRETVYGTKQNWPKNIELGGSPGLVVTGGDSHSEGRGFESQCCILDGNFSH